MKSPQDTEDPVGTTPQIGARLWRMLVAAAIGWLAGFIASLPFQFSELAGVAAGDERLLIDSLFHALLVWLVVTMGIGIVSVVAVLGPAALLFSTRRVLQHPRIAAAALPCLLLFPLGYHIFGWFTTNPGPYTFRGPMYWDYTVFLLVFYAVTSIAYLRLLRRRLRPARNSGKHRDSLQG